MNTLELDHYEVANLREGLLFLRTVGGDTGDWLCQILMKLPATPTESKPNKTAHEQQVQLAVRIGWKSLFS